MEKFLKTLNTFCKNRNIKNRILRYKIHSGETEGVLLTPQNTNCDTLILVCHSLGSDKYYPFIELFMGILEAGFPIFSIDLDGHGKNNSHIFSYDSFTFTVSDTLDFIEKTTAYTRKNIILLGHSMGGCFCLNEAPKNEVKGIVTISSPHRIHHSVIFFLEFLFAFSFNVIRQFKYYSIWESIPAFYKFKRKEYPCRTIPNGKPYFENISKGIENLTILKKIQNTSIPYLQIHGYADLIVSINQAKEIFSLYSGKKEKLYLNYSNHLTTIFVKKVKTKIIEWIGTL